MSGLSVGRMHGTSCSAREHRWGGRPLEWVTTWPCRTDGNVWKSSHIEVTSRSPRHASVSLWPPGIFSRDGRGRRARGQPHQSRRPFRYAHSQESATSPRWPDSSGFRGEAARRRRSITATPIPSSATPSTRMMSTSSASRCRSAAKSARA